jgi:hypothetical protein
MQERFSSNCRLGRTTDFFERPPCRLISHNPHAIAVDPRGRIRNILPGNQWTPEQLIEAMVQAGGQPVGKRKMSLSLGIRR